VLEFLQSQEVQPVVEIPTKWLKVGHVDEVVGFTGAGNTVVVADPRDAYAQLATIPKDDRAKTVFFAYSTSGTAPETGTASADSAADNLREAGVDFTKKPWSQFSYVRIISGAGAGQVAHIDASSRDKGVIKIDQVWNTGEAITPATLSKAAPTQKTWFTPPKKGDEFVLVENTRFWSDEDSGLETPAFVTVQEVLADANLKDFNTKTVQDGIKAVKKALDDAAGEPLKFVDVPVIYAGDPDKFGTNRKTVAFTPGLANVQPVAGQLYFPRQFGPVDAAGNDIFETVTKKRLPNALFVDDWDVYHRFDGEVHCGSVTKRQLPGVDWWKLT
jgi:hypothetical protein